MCGLSPAAASGGHSLPLCAGLSLRWPLPSRSTGSRCVGFSSCGMRAPEHRLSSCGSRAQLLHISSVAPWHVGSSWTRDRTCIPCIGRRILNHCATREVSYPYFYTKFSSLLSGLTFFFWLCHEAFRILVPQPGIEFVPPALGAWSLNHWTTREVPKWTNFKWLFFLIIAFIFRERGSQIHSVPGI